MTQAPFTLVRPERLETSVIFASPHSGRDYPPASLAAAVPDERGIRSSEDAYVDELIDAAPRYGAPFLAARAPRAYVDLNRAPEELDPALIEGVRRAANNPRIASGLGVVPRVVANGRAIYRGKIGLDEVHGRINRHWRPYHDTLQSLIDDSHRHFGEAILIDCHSMPHEALESVVGLGGRHPDVVIGDRFGAAAANSIVERVEAALASAGLRVVRNTPFAGAYITQHYGRPSRRQHAIQIEIDRRLYLDERRIAKSEGFGAFRALLETVIAEIAQIGRPAASKIAAE